MWAYYSPCAKPKYKAIKYVQVASFESNVTRAEMAGMLLEAFGLP